MASSHMGLLAYVIIVKSQSSSKYCDASSIFTSTRSHSFQIFTKLIVIFVESIGVIFQSHLAQCLETHPPMPHTPLLGYFICAVEDLSCFHNINCCSIRFIMLNAWEQYCTYLLGMLFVELKISTTTLSLWV